ncbi:tryptophan synthase subunit alpha [Ammoniphilus sp. CFH 90114]|uniref:tryptophan synthase subunit alpha n=1 Tax=Ammoniphilus sp. CFH 90114 TaxID=2493665 RepID=UPI00100E85E8|nr:tryptophan synthase subunit alpha [Ammoniphilus sp. CFH 90114]RXT13917.1 tryptophan synthase subunit alpha [Ammoniphilus sp. CFH 90114]
MNHVIGKNAIEQKFADRKDPLFIPFITAGDPAPETTIEIAIALEAAGADILELGVPYSDPLADGPTIQRASARALRHQISIRDCVHMVGAMREKGLTIPVILFTYFNPVMQYGVERLFEEMKVYGLDGILIPDLPVEESGQVKELSQKAGLPLISLVAPTSQKRIQKIAEQADGFLYCVSSLGVTGARSELGEGVTSFLQEVRKHSRVPVAVGFGISRPEQMGQLAPHCDGLIVGSALVQVIEEAGEQLINTNTKEKGLEMIKMFVQNLKSGVR